MEILALAMAPIIFTIIMGGTLLTLTTERENLATMTNYCKNGKIITNKGRYFKFIKCKLSLEDCPYTKSNFKQFMCAKFDEKKVKGKNIWEINNESNNSREQENQ